MYDQSLGVLRPEEVATAAAWRAGGLPSPLVAISPHSRRCFAALLPLLYPSAPLPVAATPLCSFGLPRSSFRASIIPRLIGPQYATRSSPSPPASSKQEVESLSQINLEAFHPEGLSLLDGIGLSNCNHTVSSRLAFPITFLPLFAL